MIANGCKCYNIQEILVYMRTNEDFYKRRSGLKYLKKILSFKKQLYKQKYISSFDLFLAFIAHSVVCLMPNSLRKHFYLNMLRSKN